MAIPSLFDGRLRLPVICSPMFLVSGVDLVVAQCKAGLIGTFPALNARPQNMLDDWLIRIKATLAEHEQANGVASAAPFGVNQICHSSNDRLQADVEACVRHRVPVIITGLQLQPWLVEAVHDYGGIVFHDVTTARHAMKAIECGVDGLILVCAGAGGHAGTLSPFALLPEIRRVFAGPIALAGAISTGAGILAAQTLGADFAYMGTRFIATREANADPLYKQMIFDSTANDIVYTSLFSGISANYLKASVRKAGLDPDNLAAGDKSKMNYGSEAKAWRDIWSAGQGVGSIDNAPSVSELVTALSIEYKQAFANLDTCFRF